MIAIIVGVLLVVVGVAARSVWVIYYGLTRYPIEQRLKAYTK